MIFCWVSFRKGNSGWGRHTLGTGSDGGIMDFKTTISASTWSALPARNNMIPQFGSIPSCDTLLKINFSRLHWHFLVRDFFIAQLICSPRSRGSPSVEKNTRSLSQTKLKYLPTSQTHFTWDCSDYTVAPRHRGNSKHLHIYSVSETYCPRFTRPGGGSATTIPGGGSTMPFGRGAMPGGGGSMPFGRGAMPGGGGSMPFGRRAMPGGGGSTGPSAGAGTRDGWSLGAWVPFCSSSSS